MSVLQYLKNKKQGQKHVSAKLSDYEFSLPHVFACLKDLLSSGTRETYP
jgi:hypothetical protein